MDFLADVVGEEVRSIEEDYGNGFVRLATSEAARRQAKHDIRCVEDIVIELLRNARDAHAKAIYVATATEGSKRTLVIIDDGDGIRADMWDQIFEPRVTSKLETVHVDDWGVHGRGMALFSIKENAVSANIVASEAGKGSVFCIKTDSELLAERADQSSWPTIQRGEGETRVRGPRNIIRTIVEFALAHPEIEIHYGSIPEIVASLSIETDNDFIATPIQKVCDAHELQEIASECGLEISERTAYRIISGQLVCAQNIQEHVQGNVTIQNSTVDISLDMLEKDTRGLKIASDDMDMFCLALEKAFDSLGEKYYLDLIERVEVRHQGDLLRATFRFDKQ